MPAAGAPARPIAAGLGIYGLLAAVLLLALVFVPGFAAANNLANVITQSSALGLIAIGQTFGELSDDSRVGKARQCYGAVGA